MKIEGDKIHLYDTFNISLGGTIQVIKEIHLIEKGDKTLHKKKREKILSFFYY